MEKIEPPEASACLLRAGQLIEAPATLQELGIYSSMFIDLQPSNSDSLIQEHNIFGKLIRTKAADSDEGGVVAGFSVVDQPYLTEEIGKINKETHIKQLVSNF